MDPGDGHAAGLQRDHEEDQVPPEPGQREHLDGEQIAGREALPMRLQECLPGYAPAPLGSRVDPVVVQDPLHRGPSDLVAEVRERPADPCVPPLWILDRHPDHERGHFAAVAAPRRALVLGGGDGMAVREILKDDRVERITLVDLDPVMTEIFVGHDEFAALNDYALRSPRVELVNADAFVWLEEDAASYDFIVVDFPDPSNFSLGKLYTTTFYQRLAAHLNPGGVVAVQSTSPLVSRQAFWCIVETVRATGLYAAPYHASVPTFGEWGYLVASREPFQVPDRFPGALRFLTPAIAPSLFEFPADMARVPVEVNHLNNQILVQYHADGWDQYARTPAVGAE